MAPIHFAGRHSLRRTPFTSPDEGVDHL